jgi:hypothetical protein
MLNITKTLWWSTHPAQQLPHFSVFGCSDIAALCAASLNTLFDTTRGCLQGRNSTTKQGKQQQQQFKFILIKCFGDVDGTPPTQPFKNGNFKDAKATS